MTSKRRTYQPSHIHPALSKSLPPFLPPRGSPSVLSSLPPFLLTPSLGQRTTSKRRTYQPSHIHPTRAVSSQIPVFILPSLCPSIRASLLRPPVHPVYLRLRREEDIQYQPTIFSHSLPQCSPLRPFLPPAIAPRSAMSSKVDLAVPVRINPARRI